MACYSYQEMKAMRPTGIAGTLASLVLNYLTTHPEKTQGDVARLLGVSQPHLSQILNGRKRPSTKLFDRAVQVLGSDLSRHTPAGDLESREGKGLHLRVVPVQDATYLSKATDAGGSHGTIGKVDPFAALDARIADLAALADSLEVQLGVLASVSDAVTDRTAALLAASDQQQRDTARVLQALQSGIPRKRDEKHRRPPRTAS